MRISRTGVAVLAVASIAAVTLAGCGFSTGGAAAKEEASVDLAQIVAEQLESQPGTAHLIEYGKTVRLDMTDPRIQAKTGSGGESIGGIFDSYLKGKIEEHRHWTPTVDIKVDNARVLEDEYICLDFDISNNIPILTGFSGDGNGEGWITALPTELISGTVAQIQLRPLDQYVTADHDILDPPENVPLSAKVDYGLPGLTYDEETLTETSSGLAFAELGETIEGGHSYDSGRGSGGSGITALPAGGQLKMTRCWTRGPWAVENLDETESTLPESLMSGGFAFGMEIVVPTAHAIVAVPFGMVD